MLLVTVQSAPPIRVIFDPIRTGDLKRNKAKGGGGQPPPTYHITAAAPVAGAGGVDKIPPALDLSNISININFYFNII